MSPEPPSVTPAIAWWRPEPFGAWVRLGDATLAAVDHELCRRLGLDDARKPSPLTLPLEAHVAINQRCSMKCPGCYQGATPDGAQPPFDVLQQRLRVVAGLGVSTVAFGGGEPLERDDLDRLAKATRDLGLVPVMTTNGHMLTAERARSLRGFAQVNVSHDGISGGYASTRGSGGATSAERAIVELERQGVAVGINYLLTRETFPFVEATVERVAALGAREVQLLRFKPGGRASIAAYEASRLRDDQVEGLMPLLERLSEKGQVSVRIDCAMVPLLCDSLCEREGAVDTLYRFGVFGCEAARHLTTVRVDGSLLPCSFWPGGGNQVGVDAWGRDPGLQAVRAFHAALPYPCSDCALVEVCRGGCQVVSQGLLGRLGPDPDCPRVRRG